MSPATGVAAAVGFSFSHSRADGEAALRSFPVHSLSAASVRSAADQSPSKGFKSISGSTPESWNITRNVAARSV